MSRLIDADELPKYTGYALSASEVAKAVENAPTVDAVPVVRCRECEHGEYDDAIEDEYCYHCRYDGFSYNKADHFCSDGKHKEGQAMTDGKDYPPYLDYPKERKKQTNADKYFRNATDEELARFQSKHIPRNCPHGVCKHTEDSVSCCDCWLDWLKQEVESDG